MAPEPTHIPTPPPERPTAPTPKPIVIARLKKTPCFGQCPAFEAEIMSDGTAIWRGEKNVARLGLWQAVAPATWRADLFRQAEERGFFKFEKMYPTNGRKIADFPVTTTFLKAGEKERSVEDNFDAPVDLQNFEQYFLEKLEALDWEKGN